MSKRTKITLGNVKSLKPGEEIWDSEVIGFTARRREGETSFCIVYRNAQRQRRRYTIGKLGALSPDRARSEAGRLLGNVALGFDPQADKLALRTATTMDELFALYLEEARAGRVIGRHGTPKKAITQYQDANAIRAHLSPLLGDRKVRDVTRSDVEATMHAIASGKTARSFKGKARGVSRIAGGKGAATRTMGLLGSIFTFAVTRDMIESNPVSRIRKFAGVQRDRRLSDEEFAALATGLRASEGRVWPPAIAALNFLALTGWRSGEVLGLRWRDIDLVRRVAFLSDTKTGRSLRPLSHAAIDILKSMTRNSDSDLVFSASRPGVVMSGFKRHAKRIIAAAGLPSDITPHVLRHSFASVANDLGLSDATIGMMIGHKGRSITTSRYVHGADAVLLAAADQVADKIISLMGEAKSDNKVIELRRL
jgi:integrase